MKDYADFDGEYEPETLESAGCTGGCEAYDEDGLPDCSKCSQGKKVKFRMLRKILRLIGI